METIIFFTLVIFIYGLVNYYVFKRGLRTLPTNGLWRTVYKVVFWILPVSFVFGRILERVWIGTLSDILVWIGSFWLGALLYFFLIVVLFDFLKAVNKLFSVIPSFSNEQLTRNRPWLFGGSVFLVAVLLTAGYLNAINPRVTQVTINIQKNAGKLTSLNAVLMSDLHLGTKIGTGRLEKIAKMTNQLNPDIILLAGDILDEDLAPVKRQNIGYSLQKLEAPLGVFGVMGNHEYIGGHEAAYRYLNDHGITVLRDTVLKIDDSFYLVGREDFQKRQFTGLDRKPFDSLMIHADPNFPVIVLDHQPFHPELAARSGADLLLSGHTHHGQLWPLNFITRAIYTVSHGYSQIGNMHFYVTNGVGTWGPPIRTGNRPEIVQLIIRFGLD